MSQWWFAQSEWFRNVVVYATLGAVGVLAVAIGVFSDDIERAWRRVRSRSSRRSHPTAR